MRDQAAQAPEHHRHVRAEHAPAYVCLVDDDEREPQEEVGPARVIGEQRQMQHVGVGHHEVGVLADQRTLGLRGVPVVHGGLELGQLQRPYRPQLIARERLRRVEVERGRLGRGERRLRERGVVHERLPARRAGGHHEVTSAAQDRQPVGLIRVETAHPRQSEP